MDGYGREMELYQNRESGNNWLPPTSKQHLIRPRLQISDRPYIAQHDICVDAGFRCVGASNAAPALQLNDHATELAHDVGLVIEAAIINDDPPAIVQDVVGGALP